MKFTNKILENKAKEIFENKIIKDNYKKIKQVYFRNIDNDYYQPTVWLLDKFNDYSLEKEIEDEISELFTYQDDDEAKIIKYIIDTGFMNFLDAYGPKNEQKIVKMIKI